MDYKMQKGIRVKITKDVREGGSATGKEGKFVGNENSDTWFLCTADGKPEHEAYELPDGYVEWDSENEPFPQVACGIRSENPRFLLDDGTYIHGGQCYWKPTNPSVGAKMDIAQRELMKKMGMSDEEIQSMYEKHEEIVAQQ